VPISASVSDKKISIKSLLSTCESSLMMTESLRSSNDEGAYPSIRGTSVRILLITSSLCWCVAGADWRRNGRQSPPRSKKATRSRTGANSRHLLRGLSSLRSLLLPLLGESSHGGGNRTVPLHGATSGSSVRHVVWKKHFVLARDHLFIQDYDHRTLFLYSFGRYLAFSIFIRGNRETD